jgi:hypothetical protein
MQMFGLTSVAALLIMSGVAYGEEAVVVRSSAISQIVGTSIADGEIVTVPEGTSIAVVFRSGQTLIIDGPYSAPLREIRAKRGASLQDLQGVDTSVFATSRDMATGRTPVPLASRVGRMVRSRPLE